MAALIGSCFSTLTSVAADGLHQIQNALSFTNRAFWGTLGVLSDQAQTTLLGRVSALTQAYRDTRVQGNLRIWASRGERGENRAEAVRRILDCINSRETNLNLSNLGLKSLPSLSLPHLTGLNISGNRLSSIPPTVTELNSLIHLHAENNPFQTIPAELANLQTLRDLRVDETVSLPLEMHDKALKLGPVVFRNLLHKWVLQAPPEERQTRETAKNRMFEVAFNPALTSLNLQRLNLSSLPNCIGQIKHLQTIDLSGNHLAELPHTFSQLVNLRTLSLANNGLIQIPEDISLPSRIQKLDFSNNLITQVPTNLTNLEYLQNLNLRENKLSQFDRTLMLLHNKVDIRNNSKTLTILASFLFSALIAIAKLFRINLERFSWYAPPAPINQEVLPSDPGLDPPPIPPDALIQNPTVRAQEYINFQNNSNIDDRIKYSLRTRLNILPTPVITQLISYFTNLCNSQPYRATHNQPHQRTIFTQRAEALVMRIVLLQTEQERLALIEEKIRELAAPIIAPAPPAPVNLLPVARAQRGINRYVPNVDQRNQLKINPSDITDDPISILRLIAPTILTRGTLPIVIQFDDNGAQLRGIDNGGLRVSLATGLFQEIFKKNESKLPALFSDDLCIPKVDSNNTLAYGEQIESYKGLGALFGVALLNGVDQLRVGQQLHPVVFSLIQKVSSEELELVKDDGIAETGPRTQVQAMMQKLRRTYVDSIYPHFNEDLKKKIADGTATDNDFDSGSTLAEFEETSGINGVIQAALAMAKSTKATISTRQLSWNEVVQGLPDAFREKIQGKLDLEQVRRAFCYRPSFTNQGIGFSQIQTHLERWIREADLELLGDLIECMSGQRVLAPETDLNVEVFPGQMNPGFHTCTRTIDLGNEVNSYEDFKNALELSLNVNMREINRYDRA